LDWVVRCSDCGWRLRNEGQARMTTKQLITICVICLVVGLGIGWFGNVYRTQRRIAGYEDRERLRLEKIQLNEAEQNALRGQNDLLRQENSKLSSLNESQEAIIKERGGSIAREQEKLKEIDAKLNADEQVILQPADKCVRCRRFSESAMAVGVIDRPLSCREECP
jgi:uncharacterized protein HemX